MVTVSETAKNKIVELRQADGHQDDYQIRVGVLGGGCSGLTYNLEFNSDTKPTDMIFEDKGVKIIVDKKVYYISQVPFLIFLMALMARDSSL